ncbi:MAG: NAD(P)-binding domain-containing protein, partial [Acidobacteriota bacterium]|nr:NAD(P)-binding domain-containing protein [Acidobacteriota bacterium]
MSQQSEIGLVGLAVMGQNLLLNTADHGFRVTAYNRTAATTDAFLEGPARGKPIVGAKTPEELVASLARPRRILMMVKAGPAVDAVIDQLVPLLEEGDILIDGGNSHFEDTERRIVSLRELGILYLGTGVSGGEEGARHGPSIMPGGEVEAWPHVKKIFQSIAAKVGANDDIPCCDWIGPGGSGHFVKMVHNGIEYGLMAAYAEGFNILRHAGIGKDEHEKDA